MKKQDFEARMRQGEHYHDLRVLPGAYIVIRVDGRSFHKVTETMNKPFDDIFHDHMVKTATSLLTEIQGVYAYTQSEEISILLSKDSPFDRKVEKLVSVSAAKASSVFSTLLGYAVDFDSRLWIGANADSTIDYFQWRQVDATRNALNSLCYWTLRHDGLTAEQATRGCEDLQEKDKHDLLYQYNVNFNDLPAWQRRGTGIYWHDVYKPCINPIDGSPLLAKRRKAHVDEDLPIKENYSIFLNRLIQPPFIVNIDSIPSDSNTTQVTMNTHIIQE